MARRVAIGIQKFSDIREGNYFLLDSLTLTEEDMQVIEKAKEYIYLEFLQTYYDQFFDDAGVSIELFNSTKKYKNLI